MIIYPAIDLKNNQVVRLTQGDYNRVDVYHTDPVAVAKEFAAAGARYLHVVDLDGAKDGALSNFAAVQAIVQATDMKVEIGGGIRTAERIQKYLDVGVDRVILGTAALKDPAFLQQMVDAYGSRIVVGVDAKDGFVATEGWLDVSATDSVDFCRTVQGMGVQHVIYTDIAKDGAMEGTNLAIYKTLRSISGLTITASGGVSTMDDIRALRDMGVQAAIVGKAIYVGALDLKEVLQTASEVAQ